MQIREAVPSDLDNIVHLHAQSWRLAYRGILSDAYLDGDLVADRLALWAPRFAQPAAQQRIVVAEIGQNLVGLACAFGDHDAQWGTLLENLHVSPQYKGTGIGTALVAHVAAWCAQTQSSDSLHLWVLALNGPAQAFYKQLGAKPVEESVWDAPDGNRVAEVRYAWSSLRSLLRQSSPSSVAASKGVPSTHAIQETPPC